jgi:Sporulation and spore germination
VSSRPFLLLTSCLFVLTIAMSLYVWQLRKHADAVPPMLAAPQAVAPPGTGPAKQATLWVAYDNPGVLRTNSVSLPLSSERQRRAAELLRALLNTYSAKDSPHRLPPTAEIHNVYFVDPGLVVIDVNSALADGQTSGVLAEELTVASFVQTLTANLQGILRVKILVDGKERGTLAGHADISGIYDVSQVAALAKQLSSQ